MTTRALTPLLLALSLLLTAGCTAFSSAEDIHAEATVCDDFCSTMISRCANADIDYDNCKARCQFHNAIELDITSGEVDFDSALLAVDVVCQTHMTDPALSPTPECGEITTVSHLCRADNYGWYLSELEVAAAEGGGAEISIEVHNSQPYWLPFEGIWLVVRPVFRGKATAEFEAIRIDGDLTDSLDPSSPSISLVDSLNIDGVISPDGYLVGEGDTDREAKLNDLIRIDILLVQADPQVTELEIDGKEEPPTEDAEDVVEEDPDIIVILQHLTADEAIVALVAGAEDITGCTLDQGETYEACRQTLGASNERLEGMPEDCGNGADDDLDGDVDCQDVDCNGATECMGMLEQPFRISEVGVDASGAFVEIINLGDSTFPLEGLRVNYTSDGQSGETPLPNGAMLGPRMLNVVRLDSLPNLLAGAGSVQLNSPEGGSTIDDVGWMNPIPSGSICRCGPFASADWQEQTPGPCSEPTPNKPLLNEVCVGP